jgi:hypothetical protein
MIGKRQPANGSVLHSRTRGPATSPKTPAPTRKAVSPPRDGRAAGRRVREPLLSIQTERLLFASALLLLAGGLSVGVLYLLFPSSRGPQAAAGRFLALVAQGKTHEACLASASAFRKRMTPGMLLLQAQRWGLEGDHSAAWTQVALENDRAVLEGTLTTRKGVLGLVVHLVRESEEWRVLSAAGQVKAEEGAEEDEGEPEH